MVTAMPEPKERRVDDPRLVRMEGKIDDLIESHKELVAVQRDIHHLEKNYDRLYEEFKVLKKQVGNVTTAEASSSSSSAKFENMILVGVSALVGAIGAVIVGLFL